jgi:hypothetical protein
MFIFLDLCVFFYFFLVLCLVYSLLPVSLVSLNCEFVIVPSVFSFFYIVFGLTRQRLEPTIYRTRDEHATYYTTDVVKSILVKHAVLGRNQDNVSEWSDMSIRGLLCQ